MKLSELFKEEKELDLQIEKYQTCVVNMKKEIRKISRKRTKLSQTLEANRARDSLVRIDVRQSRRHLEDVQEKIGSYNIRIEKGKEKTALDLKDIKNLKTSIIEQINSVRQNIAAVASMGCGWEDNTKDVIFECNEAKNLCFKTFSRWSTLWPGLSLWLTSETDINASISALASQQGLVGEWVSLRAIACEIKSISDMSAKLKETQIGATQSFKAALTTLRNKSKIDTENIINYINELKQEVRLLEKQRRQIRSLLLDLSYGLQEDCETSAMRGKETASSAQLELLELESAQTDTDGLRTNSPFTVNLTNDVSLRQDEDHPNMVSVVSSKKRGIETDNYFTGGTGTVVGFGTPSAKSQSRTKKFLVDKWLKQLKIHLNNDLGKAIKKALEVKDPHLFSPPSSAKVLEPPTPSDRRDSNARNIVPFESMESRELELQEWRKSIDELRISLTALETRSVWRNIQRASANYLSNAFQTSESEWFNYIEAKEKSLTQNQQISPQGHILRNGITISLPDEGSIRHTFPASRGSVRFDEKSSEAIVPERKHPNLEANLIKGVKGFHDWQIFRRTCLNAAMATGSLYPSAPQYLFVHASKVARGPQIHTIANEEIKTPTNKEKFLTNSPRAPAYTPKSNRRKPKVNSEAERFVRRTERKQRIQTLVKKFQVNAQQNADKRGAVVVKEKFHIPSFVPKFDPNERQLILKPSQMFENSVSSGLDSDSSFLKEEDDDDILEEMSTRSVSERDSKQNSFVLPPIDALHPQKYSMLERIINREAEDQVITQLTLRMGGEPVNVVVYWSPREECLRLNAFCFQGSEEYTFTISQSTIEQLFQGVPHLQAAQMQSPYLLHNLVERMKIERMRRKDALAVMMKLNKMPNDKVAAKLAREGGLDTASVESILTGTPLPSSAGTTSYGHVSDEEDRVRVITLRSIATNVLVMCCIAKVRNSHWEQLLKAVPKIEHRSHSIEEFLSKPSPKKAVGRHSVY